MKANTYHMMTAFLLLVCGIAAIVGLSGSGGNDAAWAYTSLKIGDTSCINKGYYGLSEVKYVTSGCGIGDGTLKVDYDDNTCTADFCKPCLQAGKGILAFQVLALIGTCIATGAVFMRFKGMGGERMPLIAQGCVGFVCFCFFVSFVIWSARCQPKIAQYQNDLTKNLANYTSVVVVYASFGLAIVAWLFAGTGLYFQRKATTAEGADPALLDDVAAAG